MVVMAPLPVIQALYVKALEYFYFNLLIVVFLFVHKHANVFLVLKKDCSAVRLEQVILNTLVFLRQSDQAIVDTLSSFFYPSNLLSTTEVG